MLGPPLIAMMSFARCVLLGVVAFVAVCAAQVGPPAAKPGGAAATGPRDSLLIVGLSPESFVDGVETEVEVTVAYELLSQDQALIEIAANTTRAQSAGVFASQRVAKGTGTVTIKGKLVPRYWTSTVPTKLSAFLVVAGEELMQRKAVGSDHKKVVVALRPNRPETYATNPNPRDVFEDGIKIKSISPDTFVAGQPVDVEVVVSYELLSREEGEIALGFSIGSGSGVTMVSRMNVKMGKGDVVVRGRVTPRRTGALPFGKIAVHIAEFPHRARFSPLATDSKTVEVK